MAGGSHTEIAQAYVTIIPSMKDARKTIADEIGAETIGTDAGGKIGGGILAGIKEIAIGTALGNLLADGISMAIDGAKQAFADAFQNAADYEQLIGGMDKLYGDASARIQALAQDAYRTSGLSANEYMEQATRFSASLINDLGGDVDAAAELTDIAMRAMSDNVNTFGTDMGNVQNAFQGFARGNYTMLDNLSLGYAGSKQGMEQLIADANEYARSQGMAGDLVMDSFADQIRAIELIQEKQGIAGTTAKEAANTMSGSLAMLGASWQNLLTSLAGDQTGIDAAISQVIESLGAAAANVVPAVLRIGMGAISAIPQLIASAAQTIGETLVPMLDEMTGGAASEIMGRIGEIIAPLRDNVLPVIQDVFQRIGGIIQTVAPIIGNIANGAMRILAQAAEAVGWAFNALSPVISFLADAFGGALAFALNTVAGIFNTLGEVIQFIADLVEPVATFIVEEFEMVAERLGPIIDGIGGLIGGIGDFLADPLGAIGDFVTGGSRDMERLERNANKSTQTMEREVTRNTNTMARSATASTNAMASSVTSSMNSAAATVDSKTQGMATTTANNTRSMATTSQANMNSMQASIRNAMDAAAKTTANQTRAMQNSINGVQGRTVSINATTNDVGGIVSRVNSVVSSVRNATATITVQKRGINGIEFTTSQTAHKITGRVYEFAKGGIVKEPTYSLIGEAGYSEAVIPLTPQGLKPITDAINDGMGAGVTITGNTFNVRRESDIKAVAYELNNMINRQNGGRL